MDQILNAISEKKLSLVKTLLRSVSKEDAKKTWDDYYWEDYSHMSYAIRVLRGDYFRSKIDEFNILHLAAFSGYTSMVRAILDSKPGLLNTKTGRAGLTSLQIAILTQNTKTAKYLVERKANLKGALAMAAIHKRNVGPDNRFDVGMIRFLIEKGANVNEKVNDHGATPIFYACSEEAINELVRKGANINQKDTYGWTPLMALCGLVYMDSDMFLSDVPNMVVAMLNRGASVRLCGRNREPREYEKKITVLHALAHAIGTEYQKIRPEEFLSIYAHLNILFREERLGKPKTTLGNTPLMYLVKHYNKCAVNPIPGVNERPIWAIRDFARVFEGIISSPYGERLTEKNANGKTIQQHLKSISNRINLPSNFVNRYITNPIPYQQIPNKINNIHIPKNLSLMDPIVRNNVNINNAYIIKKDLLNKTIRNGNQNKRVKEVKTVYNKSSLNRMVATGRSLVSPITRRPFTVRDIVRLRDVVPSNEMNRYKGTRA